MHDPPNHVLRKTKSHRKFTVIAAMKCIPDPFVPLNTLKISQRGNRNTGSAKRLDDNLDHYRRC